MKKINEPLHLGQKNEPSLIRNATNKDDIPTNHEGSAHFSSRNPVKLQDLKQLAYAIAKECGLSCTQTKHFKKRGLTVGLDLRFKRDWQILIDRLNELKGGVLVPFLLKTSKVAA
ncbi:MAG: hypothetical protein KME30_32735 [Iphinoe sp. HA4291-MV1]|jgi:hypothetical protein|nr:hypothetical protein [Iphinoe sp. HA4291-MV1]